MPNQPLAAALRVLAVIVRVIACALFVLVAADVILPSGPRALLVEINLAVSSFIPDAISGLLVLQTPFGGAFRGDFALAALILLIAGWALACGAGTLERRSA